VFPEFFALKDKCPKSHAGCWYLQNWTFGDIHLNANGNAIVADKVSQSLTDVPVVKHPQTTSVSSAAEPAKPVVPR